jgi:hypothetical protein
VVWSCEATSSSGVQGIILSDLEYGVRTHHDHLRQLMPVLNDQQEQERHALAHRNEALLKG